MTENPQRSAEQGSAADRAVMDEGEELRMLRWEVGELEEFQVKSRSVVFGG